jgi:UDP-MurNAc hydroxylase
MATTLKFLSHASCMITSESSKLLFDPWLIGTCYWKSWWNYPPVEAQVIKDLNPTAIYITHVHWDHWHGPSLKKKFDKNTLIITHKEPNGRSVRDLKSIGFRNIKLLNHGESYELGDITITPYQFGLFLNDSAVVVETHDMRLLNANDCKIAGASLRQILKKHGKFDFALRSHSSANDRVCYRIPSDKDFINDDPMHYAKSFMLFMEAVNPKFAIPFASNHVHLHKDVFHFNKIINDPVSLKQQIQELGGITADVKIMLSGDTWSSQDGFCINDVNRKYFLFKESEIEKYQFQNSEKLNLYYKREGAVRITQGVLNKFERQIKGIPLVFRLQFKNWKFQLELFSDSGSEFYEVTPKTGSIAKLQPPIFECEALIRVPKKIFKDAVSLNMFHHSSISKRNEYIFSDRFNFQQFEKFQKLLELIELEVFPLTVSYFVNIIIAYSRRWRELLVYFQAFLLKRKGMPMYGVEEEILRKT